ncbi:hypothetical protein BH10PSE19_BH10PSE19_00730 [soil metagenome]
MRLSPHYAQAFLRLVTNPATLSGHLKYRQAAFALTDISRTYFDAFIPYKCIQREPIMTSTTKILRGMQIGWGCQLYAIANAVNDLYERKEISSPALPARKRDAKAKDSLRKIAKVHLKLPVPDLLTHPQQLVSLATHHPEVHANYSEYKNEIDYTNALKQALDAKQIPLVHYDMNPTAKLGEVGQPVCVKGANFHCGILTGYSSEPDGALYFLSSHQGKTLLIKAKTLYESSQQLSTHTPVAEALFVKVKTRKTNEGAWFPENKIRNYVPSYDEKAVTSHCKRSIPFDARIFAATAIFISPIIADSPSSTITTTTVDGPHVTKAPVMHAV